MIYQPKIALHEWDDPPRADIFPGGGIGYLDATPKPSKGPIGFLRRFGEPAIGLSH